MNVSREFAIEHLKGVRKGIGDWIRELEKPGPADSEGVLLNYPSGVPRGLSVSSLEGIPVEQLRAELLAMAGILEALATAQ